jgi:hypothetical protein
MFEHDDIKFNDDSEPTNLQLAAGVLAWLAILATTIYFGAV